MSIRERAGLAKRPPTDLELADIAEENGNPDLAEWLRDRHAKKIAEASDETKHSGMSKREARMVLCSVGGVMAARSIISVDVLKSLDQAAGVLNISSEEDKDQKPPKPPRNPNARRRAGGLALGNT
jgi:hypothetical protein